MGHKSCLAADMGVLGGGRPGEACVQREFAPRLQREISRAAIVALFSAIIHPNVDSTRHGDMTQSSLLGLPNCRLFRARVVFLIGPRAMPLEIPVR